MVGERTGRIFRLGQKLQVRLTRVNLEERKIDFELVDPASAGTSGRGAGEKPDQTSGKKTRLSSKAAAIADEYEKKRKSRGKKKTGAAAKKKTGAKRRKSTVAKGPGGKPGATKARGKKKPRS